MDRASVPKNTTKTKPFARGSYDPAMPVEASKRSPLTIRKELGLGDILGSITSGASQVHAHGRVDLVYGNGLNSSVNLAKVKVSK